jgi:ankyrin repeat protein
MRELVRRGPRAVPGLISHLDDSRRTRIVVGPAGLLDTLFLDTRADRNPRTQGAPADEGVPEVLPVKRQVVTVGDLCYVALGQIVNRRYIVGGFIGYGKAGFAQSGSTTRSTFLRKQVAADWSRLTEKGHASTLINDFLKPDTEQRRIEAAVRLSYYYQRRLEPLALALLARPTYPADAVEQFVRDKLYKAADGARRRELLTDFVKRYGEPARGGVERQLLEDHQWADALDESARGRLALDLLVELFGKNRNEILSGRPIFSDALSDRDRVDFITNGLAFDASEKIEAAVLGLLRHAGEDDDLILACMTRLVGRGYDAEIERICKGRMKALLTVDAGKARREALEKLGYAPPAPSREYEKVLGKLGYSPLHIAVERGITWRVEELLAKGASPAVAARNRTTPWHLAVNGGQMNIIRALAQTRQGLEAKDPKGRTPVALALSLGDDEAVRSLAAAGCAVENILVAALADRPEDAARLLRENPGLIKQKTYDEQTALHLAAKWGNTRTLSVLLRHRAEIDAHWRWGGTALYMAALYGRYEVARLLLAHKANVRARRINSEPIHGAAYAGNRSLVELLLANGADVNAGEGANTPLHIAVERNDLALAAFLLLKAGAKPDVRGYERATPLHKAVEAGKTDLVRLLLKCRANAKLEGGKAGLPPLHLAAIQGSDTIAELLIRAGADVNAVAGKDGLSALHRAAKAGNAAIVRVLLASKASVDIRTRASRETPLHYAARAGHEDIVRMLLGAGAAINATNERGRAPIHETCQNKDTAAVALALLKRGADPVVRDDERETPLHLAAAGGSRLLVSALLARGADLEAVNGQRETPLHAAITINELSVRSKIGDQEEEVVERRWIEPSVTHMVSYLLERGANVNARDRTGQTPLHRAAAADNIDLVRLLLSRKARPKARDGTGSTPLDVAMFNKNTAVATLFRRFTPKR